MNEEDVRNSLTVVSPVRSEAVNCSPIVSSVVRLAPSNEPDNMPVHDSVVESVERERTEDTTRVVQELFRNWECHSGRSEEQNLLLDDVTILCNVKFFCVFVVEMSYDGWNFDTFLSVWRHGHWARVHGIGEGGWNNRLLEMSSTMASHQNVYPLHIFADSRCSDTFSCKFSSPQPRRKWLENTERRKKDRMNTDGSRLFHQSQVLDSPSRSGLSAGLLRSSFHKLNSIRWCLPQRAEPWMFRLSGCKHDRRPLRRLPLRNNFRIRPDWEHSKSTDSSATSDEHRILSECRHLCSFQVLWKANYYLNSKLNDSLQVSLHGFWFEELANVFHVLLDCRLISGVLESVGSILHSKLIEFGFPCGFGWVIDLPDQFPQILVTFPLVIRICHISAVQVEAAVHQSDNLTVNIEHSVTI